MPVHLLAVALGSILGKGSGLRYFSVPVNLPTEFINDMIEAANSERRQADFAFHVSRYDEGPSIIPPERAAELRSREDGKAAEALIIAKDGESKELKTLEAFVRVNPLSVINGIGGVEIGDLTLRAVCEKIASLLGGNVDEDRLARTTEYVLSYLGDAYREYGNEDISWKDAWWMHAMRFADALRDALKSTGDQSTTSIDAELPAYVFAAAGLPVPSDTSEWEFNMVKHGPKAYARRVHDRWQTGEDAHLAVTDMEMLATVNYEADESAEYPLRKLNWLRDYDATAATLQHPMLAVAYHGYNEPWHLDAWLVAEEPEFYDDITERLEWILLTSSADGNLVGVPFAPDLDPVHYIVATEEVKTDDEQHYVRLGEYFFHVDKPFGELEIGDFALATSPTKLNVSTPELVEHVDGTTLIKMQFSVRLSRRNNKWKENPYKLTIRPVVRRGRNTPFTEHVQVALLVAMPGEVSYFIVAKTSGKNASSTIVGMPDRAFRMSEGGDELLLDDDARDREIKLKGTGGAAGVLVVGPQSDLFVNQQPKRLLTPYKQFPQVRWLDNLLLPDGCELECGSNFLTVTLEDKIQRPLSPIVAAAMATVPGVHETGDMEAALLNDPRGKLEKEWLAPFYADVAKEQKSRPGFPQVLMFSRGDGAVGDLWFDKESGFHVVGTSSNKPTQPQQLVSGELASDFWDAFDDLHLNSLARGFAGITSHWPSRLRLLDLEKARVENYLSAFAQLALLAKDNSALKWLLYPFSAIVFDAVDGNTTGVLLSPLHPIRLAWTWSVQRAAAEVQEQVEDVVRLMRFVDGENMPICGPTPEGFGRLASSPLDSGPEELFVTWSYLGSINDINAGRPPPARVSGYRFPAGTASGLGKGGVAAAINDYLRVYPYVSELRLGIFAQNERPRSTELDRAIVAELDSLLRGRAGQLPGGIKVFDSKNRLGPIPDKERLLAKVVSAMDFLDRDDENRLWRFPFEWKIGTNEHVDVRFVEDSIVKVAHETGAAELEETGFLPSLPVRRGYAWLDQQRGDQWRSGCSPLVDDSQASALPGFASCLRTIESWDGEPAIWSHVPPGQSLQETGVKWMVAGNANLDPRMLSKALQRLAIADKVLWEWRPPYLPRRWNDNQSSITAANPYTVIATLGVDFKNQVKQELESSIGQSGQELFKMLFQELGARGVGIASLLSMGHQQSRGAVGFYLGFKLASWWEHAAGSNEVRMVLPLDAVNPVFESLAQVNPSDDRKKADLLLISAKRGSNGDVTVAFSPVEIKNHAARKESHPFPATSSKIVKDALSQLKNSQKLINAVIEVLEPRPRPTLLNSTMATILEIGVSLGAGENRDLSLLRDILASAASGACKFEQLPSVLFWFERFGLGHADEPFLVRKPTSVDSRAKIFIDPARCYTDIDAGIKSDVAEEFVKILGSAIRSTPVQNIGPAGAPIRDTAKDGFRSEAEPPELPHQTATAEDEHLLPNEVAFGEDVSDEEKTLRPSIGKVSIETLELRYDKIIDSLEQFNVSVRKPANVEHYTEGPASITFRVRPEQGTRPKRIDAELDSLKLALELDRDQNIKMDLNHGCVEIDVPKKDEERYFVDARDLWNAWERPSNALAVPIGVDQLNQPVSINFSSPNSPHLLIGGTTGSGKSEALNTVLYGLTEHYSHAELRLLLVDPKGTELVGFQDSPFLEAEIGWDGQDATEILDAAVNEMQDRYAKFRDARTKSLPEFNEQADEGDRLPWWLIVLDEYADLTADPEEKKKIEHYLRRLAQKARAAGIHVIIATQKPSTEVINTVLRSNLPAQLALKVRSATESRVIMNESGAETLNGKGDAFLNSEGKLIRLQCALCRQ